MNKKLFFDTYALIEIYKSSPSYEKYKKDVKIFLNKLNLLEFAYFLIRENRETEINFFFNKLVNYNIDYDEEILIKAAKMKFKFLKQRLSFIDCIGYILAKKKKIKFLTGDEKFRNRDNVEFVK